jgi:NAD(P)-dependent dehydrogenase (short-subunit alcohol dehydrogenase family)
MKQLEGKTALVTGAASGIGRATATALAAAGARVIVCDVAEPGLAAITADLGSACPLSRRVDVSDRAAMRAFAAEVHALVPALDILVNNAGVALEGGLLETSLEDWDWLLGINLGGVVHGCHFFVPPMAARGSGHVVNISSMLGYFAAPRLAAYVASKFAVLGLSESLRAELAPHGVAVSAICPGMINTGILAATRFRGHPATETTRHRAQAIFARRNFGPDKVARAVLSAIRRDIAVLPVAPEAWTLYWLKRLTPGLLGPLGRRALDWERLFG